MRTLWGMIQMLLGAGLLSVASGCTPVPVSGDAVCLGTAKPAAKLAAVLAETPDDAAAVAGQELIATLDAGCRR